MTKRWLITGASSGFGNVLAERVAARGDVAVATARREQDVAAFEHHRRLDVTDPESVTRAVDSVVDEFGGIDVLVNNAGHGLIGVTEELTDAELSSVLDVNVLGVLRVTRAVLPHMRAQRSGRIVQLSSVGGVVANPGHAAYATSKFALEGLSEALAGEVEEFGIRVTLVEPGPFRTAFAGRSMQWSTPNAAYQGTRGGALRERFSGQDGKQPGDPQRAVDLIVDCVDDPTPPLRLVLGPEANDRVRAKLESQLAELTAAESRTRDTGFAEA